MITHKYIVPLTGLLIVALAGCLQEPDVEPTRPTQLFRPISFVGDVDVVTVTFNWAPIKNASYLLEISRDSLQFSTDVKSIPVDQQSNFILDDLWSQSRYSARIKAVSKDPAVRDSEYQALTFTTGLENIFFQPDTANVTATTVNLLWEAEKATTKVDVISEDQLQESITLTADQISFGNLMVENLVPGVEYTFRIYNGEILRGTITAQTLAGGS